jgi:diguanylate cyclase
MRGWIVARLHRLHNSLFSACPAEIADALTELQYDRCSREVPLTLFVAMLSTLLIMMAAWAPGNPLYLFAIPIFGLATGIYQIWIWHIRNRLRPPLPEMRKRLINCGVWAGIFANAASLWTLYAFLNPAFQNQSILPIILMLGVLASSACYSSMPITATSVLIVGIWPCSAAMIMGGDTPEILVGTAQLIAGFMQYRFVAEQHRQNVLRLTLQRDAMMLANTDALTGLLNHRAFMAELDAVSSTVSPSQPYAVAMLDLDGFKHVNDAFGHLVGDQLLKVVAQRLSEQCQQGDHVGRLGGDEFAFIFRNVTGAVDLERRTTAIMSSLCRAVRLGETPLPVGGSLGYACWAEQGDSPTSLLASADRALYRVKRNRRTSRGEEVTHIPSQLQATG